MICGDDDSLIREDLLVETRIVLYNQHCLRGRPARHDFHDYSPGAPGGPPAHHSPALAAPHPPAPGRGADTAGPRPGLQSRPFPRPRRALSGCLRASAVAERVGAGHYGQVSGDRGFWWGSIHAGLVRRPGTGDGVATGLAGEAGAREVRGSCFGCIVGEKGGSVRWSEKLCECSCLLCSVRSVDGEVVRRFCSASVRRCSEKL